MPDWNIAGTLIVTVAPIVSAVVYVIDQRIQVRILKNNEDLLARMNGTYIRSNGATLTGAEIQRRLETLED